MTCENCSQVSMTRTREFSIDGKAFFATHIPTVTPGTWLVIHDECEVFAVLLLGPDDKALRWINPPDKRRKEVENAVRKAFSSSRC